MRKRIICPFHREQTPSCILYPETGTYKCFACGKYGKLSEISKETIDNAEDYDAPESEDLDHTLGYINQLPRLRTRGLELPQDDLGYYIVWPGGAYYKKRLSGDHSNGSKYRCPRGHSKPAFRLDAKSDYLLVIEGELNALSARAADPRPSIYCPGGAGDFGAATFERDVRGLRGYRRILVWCDRDAAGASAAIKAKARLLGVCKDVQIYLGEKDANEVLCEDGPEALRRLLGPLLGLREGV